MTPYWFQQSEEVGLVERWLSVKGTKLIDPLRVMGGSENAARQCSSIICSYVVMW